jgi:hypothetical protein
MASGEESKYEVVVIGSGKQESRKSFWVLVKKIGVCFGKIFLINTILGGVGKSALTVRFVSGHFLGNFLFHM